MSTFLDTVSMVIHDNVCADHGDPWDWHGAPTDAVFAMPEMQAIRSALRTMSEVIADHLGKHRGLTALDVLVGHLDGDDDPDSVRHIVDWVTKEAST